MALPAPLPETPHLRAVAPEVAPSRPYYYCQHSVVASRPQLRRLHFTSCRIFPGGHRAEPPSGAPGVPLLADGLLCGGPPASSIAPPAVALLLCFPHLSSGGGDVSECDEGATTQSTLNTAGGCDCAPFEYIRCTHPRSLLHTTSAYCYHIEESLWKLIGVLTQICVYGA